MPFIPIGRANGGDIALMFSLPHASLESVAGRTCLEPHLSSEVYGSYSPFFSGIDVLYPGCYLPLVSSLFFLPMCLKLSLSLPVRFRDLCRLCLVSFLEVLATKATHLLCFQRTVWVKVLLLVTRVALLTQILPVWQKVHWFFLAPFTHYLTSDCLRGSLGLSEVPPSTVGPGRGTPWWFLLHRCCKDR